MIYVGMLFALFGTGLIGRFCGISAFVPLIDPCFERFSKLVSTRANQIV